MCSGFQVGSSRQAMLPGFYQKYWVWYSFSFYHRKKDWVKWYLNLCLRLIYIVSHNLSVFCNLYLVVLWICIRLFCLWISVFIMVLVVFRNPWHILQYTVNCNSGFLCGWFCNLGFAHAIFSTHNFAHMCGDKMCYENILCVYAYKCMCSLFFFKEIFVKQYFSCCCFLFLIVYMNWVTGVCGIYTHTVFPSVFYFCTCVQCVFILSLSSLKAWLKLYQYIFNFFSNSVYPNFCTFCI